MELTHKNIIIIGKVQGVGFRYWCFNIAKKNDIKGFVKNKTDGTVYIEAEANEKQINLFIQTCYQGSPHSRVNDIIVSTGYLKHFKHFDIK